MPAVLVLTTAPSLRLAKALARSLVSSRLATCVSIKAGCVSFYRWKKKVESAKEALLIIKTTERRFDGVKALVQKKHSYEIPEIISVSVHKGSREYLSWLNESVR